MAVSQNLSKPCWIPFWLVGEFTPHLSRDVRDFDPWPVCSGGHRWSVCDHLVVWIGSGIRNCNSCVEGQGTPPRTKPPLTTKPPIHQSIPPIRRKMSSEFCSLVECDGCPATIRDSSSIPKRCFSFLLLFVCPFAGGLCWE